MPSLPYHEPDRLTILVQSSFLFLLNAIESVLNRALYCGLLGQVLLGIAFGKPGGNILSQEAQEVMVQLGYLGLILLVYEGGLSVPLQSLKITIQVSTAVACTGIAVPIALSFVLQPLMQATPLQAFAAGAALCSTSLGTAFTLLSTSGLINTRIGSVLSTAAMMDDVIGLVMVQVISNLGSASTSLNPVVVVRPVLVSLAFAILVPAILHYVIRPLRPAIKNERAGLSMVKTLFARAEARFILHCLLLYGMVAAAAWSGTSVLFTVYLTGATINWSDSQPPIVSDSNQQAHRLPDDTHPGADSGTNPTTKHRDVHMTSGANVPSPEPATNELSGQALFHRYLKQPVSRILSPLFFASIGFSIPITSLFRGTLLWRGLVYAVLMLLGKLVCGIWLLPCRSMDNTAGTTTTKARLIKQMRIIKMLVRRHAPKPKGDTNPAVQPAQTTDPPAATELNTIDMTDTRNQENAPSDLTKARETRDLLTRSSNEPDQCQQSHIAELRADADDSQPISLYPSAMLGFAMVSRGEIGFLISAVAESAGIWRHSDTTSAAAGSEASSDAFIVVTWAIVLCTFVGPVAVGLIVNRVKRLEKGSQSPGRNVLGSWGVEVH